MDDIYTCICGGQKFSVHGGAIRCANCQREYELMWDVGIDGQMESPGEFNERIRKEK